MSYDGAFENIYLVDKRIQDARATGRELCLCLLGISNAFGSVPHEAICTALMEVGAEDAFVELVQDLYRETTTCLLSICKH